MSDVGEVFGTMGGGASRRRRAEFSDDAGFSLIEVMVVVLILGVLIAIGSPTLQGARVRSWDLAARTSIRTSVSTAVMLSEFRSDFTLASIGALASAEPDLAFVVATTASTGPKVISVDSSSPSRWVATVQSASGTCFGVVLGHGGQTLVEPDSCAAADVTADAPGVPFRYTGEKVHEGFAGADTDGMCLEVVEGFVVQQPCLDTQLPVRVYTRSDGFSTLSSVDGNCFGTEGPWIAAAVIDEPCVESIDQLWTLIPAAGGLVQFKNAETGWCMDVHSASSASGASIIQWGYGAPPSGTCKSVASANNQTFSLG